VVDERVGDTPAPAVGPAERPSRLRALQAKAHEVAGGRLHPPVVTVAFIAAVLATAIEQDVFRAELGLIPTYQWAFSGRALIGGNYSTLLTSQFLTRNVFMTLSICFSLALMLGTYEALAGSVRAAIVATVSAISGPGLVTAVMGIGSALNNRFAARTLQTIDFGASAVTAGAGGAVVAIVGNKWLTRGAIAFVFGGLVFHHQLADWEHLGAFSVGVGLGWLLDRWHPIRDRAATGSDPRPRTASTRRRAIGALAVLLAALFGWTAARTAFPAVAQADAAGTSALQVLDLRYPVPSLGGDKRVLVVLPEGYDASGTTTYPVVEILHGAPGNPDDLFIGMDLLGRMRSAPPFIAVVPDGHGTATFNSDFADTSKQQLGGALSQDLQSWVDSTYRTNGHWSVMGLSSGGFGAAYLGARPGTHYDAVCAMGGNFVASASAFEGEPQSVLDAASPILHTSPDGPRTLLIAAANDTGAVRDSKQYDEALAKAGQEHHLVIDNGNHDFPFFSSEIPRCLRYVLSGSS
jgi:S-formylglutathione hydrolase FrmB/membrane associated rhomboid family serine protease